jgi:peptidoglycan hydrolase CwlO-like protein
MEKLTKIEARQRQFERDYAHEVTILKGVIGAQGIDIKEIKMDVRDISQRLESMQEDIDILNEKMGGMHEGINTLKEKMGGMEARMGGMEEDIKQILTFLTRGKSEL